MSKRRKFISASNFRQFPGYKTKIFDYSEGYSKVNLDDLSDEHTLKKLDVGIILLENEK